jgi:hypothetical protein
MATEVAGNEEGQRTESPIQGTWTDLAMTEAEMRDGEGSARETRDTGVKSERWSDKEIGIDMTPRLLVRM